MIELTAMSLSDQLSFDQVIRLLKASPLVDGIAEFGSHATGEVNQANDYDLLVLVHDLPAAVFQLVTTIDRRLADVVPVDVTVADQLLAGGVTAEVDYFAQLFLQKMTTAHILFDRTSRLTAIQRLSQAFQQMQRLSPPINPASTYPIWFWQGFGLLHLKRMAASPDPVHQTATDMMLLACLTGTWRAYFDLRGLAWTGEKAAIRYWLQQDTACYERVQAVLHAGERQERLHAYQQLVDYVLMPVGALLSKGQTAVILSGMNNGKMVNEVIDYWNGLLR